MIFVTFEGIDGSGKSTQAKLLVDRLQQTGRPVLLFREPGGTELSERIRSILLDPSLDIHPLPELLLFSSSRAQLVDEKIRPALSNGTVVVCDRFYDSTTAYQGAGRQVADLAWVQELNRHVTGGLTPDRTYLIVLSPDEALRRRRSDSDALPDDRIEKSDLRFYERVADAYNRLAEAEPERFRRLDGERSIDDLGTDIWEDLTRLLQRRTGTPTSG